MNLKLFLKQQKLRRRDFLIGSGTIITLPFFESLYANNLHAQSAAPLRVLFGHIDTGVHQNSRAGYKFEQRYIDALKPVGSHMNYYRGVTNDSGAAHHNTIANFSHGGSGTSFDHHAFNIKQAGAAAFNSVASLTTNAYASNSRWQVSVKNNKKTKPLMSLTQILDNLILSSNTKAPGTPVDSATKRKLSSLHYVVDSMKSLKNKLSPSDKQILDHHLTLIEEIEATNSGTVQEPTGSQCSKLSGVSNSVGFAKRHDLLAQMIAMSFICDSRRVINASVGAYSYNPGYEDIPSYNAMVKKIKSRGSRFKSEASSDQRYLTPGYHPMTHNYESAVRDSSNKIFLTDNEVTNVRIDISKFYIDFYVKVATILKDTQDVNGKSVLDNSLIYFGGDMGDATLHGRDHLLTVLIGKAGGKINTGKGKVEVGKKSITAFQNALLDALGSTDNNKYKNKNNVKSQINKGIFT